MWSVVLLEVGYVGFVARQRDKFLELTGVQKSRLIHSEIRETVEKRRAWLLRALEEYHKVGADPFLSVILIA